MSLARELPLNPGTHSLLFEDTYLGFGFLNTLSPVTNKMGAFVEAHPIRIFKLRLSAEGVGIFPLSKSIDSTDDPSIPFHEVAREEIHRDASRYATGSILKVDGGAAYGLG